MIPVNIHVVKKNEWVGGWDTSKTHESICSYILENREYSFTFHKGLRIYSMFQSVLINKTPANTHAIPVAAKRVRVLLLVILKASYSPFLCLCGCVSTHVAVAFLRSL